VEGAGQKGAQKLSEEPRRRKSFPNPIPILNKQFSTWKKQFKPINHG